MCTSTFITNNMHRCVYALLMHTCLYFNINTSLLILYCNHTGVVSYICNNEYTIQICIDVYHMSTSAFSYMSTTECNIHINTSASYFYKCISADVLLYMDYCVFLFQVFVLDDSEAIISAIDRLFCVLLLLLDSLTFSFPASSESCIFPFSSDSWLMERSV